MASESPLDTRVDDLMIDMGIRTKDLAAATAHTASLISKWRSGDKCPTTNGLIDMVRKYNINPDNLYWLLMGKRYEER